MQFNILLKNLHFICESTRLRTYSTQKKTGDHLEARGASLTRSAEQ
jgi:hypothetical protein